MTDFFKTRVAYLEPKENKKDLLSYPRRSKNRIRDDLDYSSVANSSKESSIG